MARRRKTEAKVQEKPEPKQSLVSRKSSRQKAKKQVLEDETVKDQVKNAINSDSSKDSNDTNGKESPQVDVASRLEMPETCLENSLKEVAVCHDTPVMEDIYEEMEIETESVVDCPMMMDKNSTEQDLFVNDSLPVQAEGPSSECVNSHNNYQVIEKGLSGLHMTELQLDESSQEQSVVDSSHGDLMHVSPCDPRKAARNARAKKNTSKKEPEDKKTRSDGSIELEVLTAGKEIKDNEHSVDSKMDVISVESCKSELDKQVLLPSDTSEKGDKETKNKPVENHATQLETASNNSGVRRSNRIKHIGLKKQRSRGRGLVIKPPQESLKVHLNPERVGGDKLASGLALESATTEQAAILAKKMETQQFDQDKTTLMSAVPQDGLAPFLTSITGCDSDSNKPVKVKSRWRRSSELEMSTSWSAAAIAAAVPQSNVGFNSTALDTLVESRFDFSSSSSDKSELNCNADSMQPPALDEGLSIPLERRVSMETAFSSPVVSAVIPDLVGAKISLPMVAEVDREMEERLSQFEHLRENLYLTDRYTNKETKRMVCDCFLTEEEIERGELGCGEDCLNRLLMIECGSRCVVGDRCTNKRFQNWNYARCEVFRTEKKGFGLRATSHLNAGEFIMEYVGEVVDSRDFRKRAKEYSKDMNRHYYFMALKSDQIIDATMKGNISRFINHSCDPNAETQKWTVNGELRIGFFTKKFVAAGEEITFDYHFQRYGKEAQKCFCEAANCRGWIGENPEDGKAPVECSDDEDDDEDELDTEEDLDSNQEERPQVVKKPKKQVRRKKREEKKIADHMEDEDLEEQIDKLCASGLKNQAHTLLLSRLMVRCRELQHRRRLMQVVQSGEQPCRRLFLDYHGLRLMWSYMMDVASIDSEEAQQLRLEMLKTLATLPIPNRTMLIDSKILSVVEKWSKQQQLGDSPTSESPADDELPASGEQQQPQQQQVPPQEAVVKDEQQQQQAKKDQSLIAEMAGKLLEAWSNLKEVFRIPKKERLEQMKEHERDADRGYKEDELMLVEKDAARDTPLSYDRQRIASSDKRIDRRRGRDSPAGEVERSNLVQVPRMNKYERRQLFALKVMKEQEERQRRQQEELWQRHQAQCLALGLDPYATAALDPHSGYPLFFDPQLAQWQAYPGLPYQQPPQLQQQPQPQQQPLPQGFAQLLPNGAQLEPPATPVAAEQPAPALDLPPKWKWARDKRGRVYYYHTRERVPQWLPPPPDHIGMQPDSGPESSSGDDDDEDDDDGDEDVDVDGDEEEEEDEEAVSGGDDDDEDDDEAASISPREEIEADEVEVATTADESAETTIDQDENDEEQPVDAEQRVDLPLQPAVKPEGTSRKRRDGLVQERIISPRREEDRVDHSKFKELKEKLRRQKEKSRLKEQEKNRKHRRGGNLKSKSHVKQAKSFQTITSDMSPTTERKIKDTFRINMAHVMVHFLNPYRKNDCKQGRITNTEDFKYLARKLTHFVLAKELKHCKSVDELECNDNVKHKAKDFVRKYMNKFGAIYQRDKDED